MSISELSKPKTSKNEEKSIAKAKGPDKTSEKPAEPAGNLTIADIAEALGISKTTVSRTLSGKGRISEATRNRVMKYVEEADYKPNLFAKGLAEQKTYNVCWATPGASSMTELPFFQRAMTGIVEVASTEDYDLLLAMIYDNNIANLRRVISNKKVDGVILGRTLVKDESIAYLKENHIPFVVIGSTEEKGVIQIDNDHIRAAKELTSFLILKGIRKFALISGSENHVVNRTRRKGFEEALRDASIPANPKLTFVGCETVQDVEKAVDAALLGGAECLVCMDDWLCHTALSKLKKDEVEIPGRIKVASFYNSSLLENYQPAITTLQYDPKELGAVAMKTLLKILAGEKVEERVLLDYEVLLKASTQ